MNGRLAVVLVNYRRWRDNIECLASLMTQAAFFH